ncbi:MAG: ABC transporter ATP-binding protein [Vreelandella alkaliphila]|uniref:ABC transporter ATP-binding protein n=2 Tax=Halomonadaceae TaxID=28256 RepID=A0A3D0KB25_9GAMM|nr:MULTISPECIES: ABC transporter ATP-binding protein [unclassified Halomonas]WKD28158.1 ABC transporter ATP-binding protein/permease [Halomonas sp. KG2]HBP41201.1 ABC transporter ATP-binding protein [Halomonas sp.]HBS81772.1 ABC transporter ATP-binding protein [Halomonas campaniensis]HCA00713.1 ABC transporter ATP-binding protein [Halomonas campaniensis]
MNTQTTPTGQGPISRILAPIRTRLLIAATLAGIGTIFTMIPLAGMAHIAQILATASDQAWELSASSKRDIAWVVTASIVSVFIGMGSMFLGELIAHLADNRLTHHLRQAVLSRLAQAPLGWFTGQTSGQVKQAMQDDIATLHSLTAHFYTAVGRALGALSISVIYLLAMDWRIAVITLLPLPGFFLFLHRLMQSSKANMGEFVIRLEHMNSAINEFISGIPDVKAFGTTGQAYRGYQDAVNSFADAFDRFTRPLVASMAHVHAMVTPVTILGLTLLCGTISVVNGWTTPVDLVPFILVAPGICAPLLLLHTLLHDLGSATGAAQRVMALLETPILQAPLSDQQPLPANNEIRFDNVSYAYDNGHRGLSNLDVTFAAGSVTAIVGPSGAGKSTLARLLLRFFDPTQGRITLGGVDLRQLSTATLYQYIGFVLQDVRLIHASIRDNIALGRPSASQQEIEDAARAANIHERILALPGGYDAVVDDATQLSGGEQQRVSIARAILLDPPLLVLDEATAAVDASSELVIQEALARLTRGRTLIVISHRLDTIRYADQILVLDDGMIVEQGNHDHLLTQHGLYARLWALSNATSTLESEVSTC